MESIFPEIARWGSMGGYAAFVWPAYAVAGAVLGGLAWHSRRAHRESEASLGRLQQRGGHADGPDRGR